MMQTIDSRIPRPYRNRLSVIFPCAWQKAIELFPHFKEGSVKLVYVQRDATQLGGKTPFGSDSRNHLILVLYDDISTPLFVNIQDDLGVEFMLLHELIHIIKEHRFPSMLQQAIENCADPRQEEQLRAVGKALRAMYDAYANALILRHYPEFKTTIRILLPNLKDDDYIFLVELGTVKHMEEAIGNQLSVLKNAGYC